MLLKRWSRKKIVETRDRSLHGWDEPTTLAAAKMAASGCIVGGAANFKRVLVGIPRERYQFLAGKRRGKVL